MPNLALIRDSKKLSGIPAPSNQLRRESHYISDPKLGRTRTRTIRTPAAAIRPFDIDLPDPPADPIENTYSEAQNYTANKPAYVCLLILQKFMPLEYK